MKRSVYMAVALIALAACLPACNKDKDKPGEIVTFQWETSNPVYDDNGKEVSIVGSNGKASISSEAQVLTITPEKDVDLTLKQVTCWTLTKKSAIVSADTLYVDGGKLFEMEFCTVSTDSKKITVDIGENDSDEYSRQVNIALYVSGYYDEWLTVTQEPQE